MGKHVIIFSGAVYDSPIWTNRQHVATRLAERGWTVLYVEPRLFLFRALFGEYPGTESVWKWIARFFISRRYGERINVVSQCNIIPWGRKLKLISIINHKLNAQLVRRHIKKHVAQDAHPPAVLIYDTEAAQYLPMFPHSRVVYDCVDDHKAQAGVDRNAKRVVEEEASIVHRADAISVTTKPLFERFSKIHSNVHSIPNAADIDIFRRTPTHTPDDIEVIPHPRIGIVGTIDPYKVDVPLLRRMAEKHRDWNIVIIGPMTNISSNRNPFVELDMLMSMANVHVLGAKQREAVPAYVHAFDVAVIPYRKSTYNTSSFPLKFWEYMAAGIPVVSSGLPALKEYAYLATVAESHADVIASIELVLPSVILPGGGSEGIRLGVREVGDMALAGKEVRIAEAQKHDYAVRVTEIDKLLSG